MLEYVSDAVVLDKEPNGDLDVRVSLFTKKYGKLKAKAKSARKITSKLSAHLEPGYISTVRVVEKNGLQVVDALKQGAVAAAPADLYLLDAMLHEADADPALWRAVLAADFAWPPVLKILGWDPEEAACRTCGREPHAFDIGTQEFFCDPCAAQEQGTSRLSVRLNGASPARSHESGSRVL